MYLFYIMVVDFNVLIKTLFKNYNVVVTSNIYNGRT